MLSSIFNWSIVAIMASFTLMPASTGRTTAPTVEPNVEEAELKGCATNFESQGLIPFYFDDSNGTSKAAVETLSNWKYLGSSGHSCDDTDEVACVIGVNEGYVVDPNGPTPTLDPLFSITGQDFNTNQAFVLSTSDGDAAIINTSM